MFLCHPQSLFFPLFKARLQFLITEILTLKPLKLRIFMVLRRSIVCRSIEVRRTVSDFGAFVTLDRLGYIRSTSTFSSETKEREKEREREREIHFMTKNIGIQT